MLEEDSAVVRGVPYVELRQSGVEDEKFLLVKFDSQADSFKSGLIFQTGLWYVRENLESKT